jgi:hypothetical protein
MKQTKTEMYSRKLAGYFIQLGLFIGLGTLTFGLSSCGGGGDSPPASQIDTSMTVTSINPPGIVASSVFQTIVLSGTNFASGVTLTFTGASGTPVVSSVAVTNSMTLTALVKIDTAPTDRFVMVSVQPASSSTAVTHVLGVASVLKKFVDHINPIFTLTASSVSCTMCHHSGANPSGGMNLNTASNLNNEASQGCTSRVRIKPGDPRRSSSVLIDKIKVPSTSIPACNGNNPMPPLGYHPLSEQEIQDIVNWVAGGAN